MMDFLANLFIAAIVVMVLAPPKWDPAIRLNEWIARRRDRKQ